jgi:hypothetical protein
VAVLTLEGVLHRQLFMPTIVAKGPVTLVLRVDDVVELVNVQVPGQRCPAYLAP